MYENQRLENLYSVDHWKILWLDLAYVYKTHGNCFSHILPFEYHKYSDIKWSTPNISITKDYKKDPTPAYQHLP